LGIDRSKVLHSAQLFASKGQFDAAISEWKKLSAESPGDGQCVSCRRSDPQGDRDL
jgi:hypothetical protein